jgi:DNA adenine methylase
MKINLKTPISYYGGKQKLASKIISLIPEHKLYCEAFTGGGAIFFAKPPSHVEVLNDTNKEMMNFYQVMQNNFAALEKRVRQTLHSRDLHLKASIIYNYPGMFDPISRAWAVWVLCTQSFCSMLDGSFGYDKIDNTTTKKIINKRDALTSVFTDRLHNVCLECADALYVIKSRDTAESFFYLDPPYFNSDCGHYDGYSEQDFENLLQTAADLQGKFLLSSYPSKVLKEYTKRNGWFTWSLESGVSVNNKSGYQKRKVEVLTANYPI